MNVMSHNISPSTLNPNAPMFIPSAYRDVEDFSDEWWYLVQSSPWFRDYWLQECFSDPSDPFAFETDALFTNTKDEEKEEVGKDLIALGVLKWRDARVAEEKARYCEKAPKIVNVRVSPRLIHQPR